MYIYSIEDTSYIERCCTYTLYSIRQRKCTLSRLSLHTQTLDTRHLNTLKSIPWYKRIAEVSALEYLLSPAKKYQRSSKLLRMSCYIWNIESHYPPSSDFGERVPLYCLSLYTDVWECVDIVAIHQRFWEHAAATCSGSDTCESVWHLLWTI